MIRNIDGSFDFGGGTKFGTLTELVDHYRENPMVEKNGGTVLHLKHVCFDPYYFKPQLIFLA